MKALLFLALMTLALGVSAQTERYSFTNLNKSVPDGSLAGLGDNRTLTSSIVGLSTVRVTLNIAGRYNGDLYAYLRHMSTQATNFCVLLNRVGRSATNTFGYGDTGLNVTLDSTASNDIHLYRTFTNLPPGSPLAGTWQPDGRNVNPLVVLDTTNRTTSLSSFNGTGGSGDWTLFLADVDMGATNLLVSWELELVGSVYPTLTWSKPADIVYGTPLSATQLNASSGGVAGTFAYSPAAGTILNAGSNQTLSVTFTPIDTANYSPTSTNVSLTVLNAPLTITANSDSKVYGQTKTYGAGSTAFASSGLTNNETIGSVTLTCAGGMASAAAGPHPITPSAATGGTFNANNYTITYSDGTLTVSKTLLTITANNANKVYGQTVTFAGTEFGSSGLVNSDTVSSVNLTSTGAWATATVAGSPYTIVPSAATGTGLANYAISYVNGTLTMSNKALTIMANTTNKVYGQTVTFAGTEFGSSGLVNSDTVSSVTLTSAGTVATATVAGSPYSIVPSAATGTGLANYAISYVNGTLTITKSATTAIVRSSGNPSLPGVEVAFGVAVSAVAPGFGTPTGVVQFRIDGTVAGSAAIVSGAAIFHISTVTVGNHSVAGEYTGDGNFNGTTNSLSPLQLINTPPVAGTDTIYRYPANDTKVEIATLLANDFDPDGDPVTFIAASTNSTHGGIVTQEGSWIVYLRPPSFTNVDSFTYTISDGRGVPVTGTVEVLIQPEAGPAVNLTIEDLGGGFYRLRFSGVPNQTTIIQYTTNLYPPDWQVLTNGTTDSYGVFDYVDQPLGGTESRFYRSLFP